MLQETRTPPDKDRKYKRPSERAALFILGIIGFFKHMFTSPANFIPRGRALQHRGHDLPDGKAIRYPHILLVEDNPDTAREFIAVIENYYVFGSVSIFVAHAFDAALTFFANEDINLVIMDADLDDDDGDGVILTRKFLSEKPDLKILANSSRGISNLKLTGFGAIETLGKRKEKLKIWLSVNDPIGSEG